MTPDNVMPWAKAVAVFGGVLIGIYAVFSPSYVWYKRQLFGWAGVVLCGFGTILIVASIFYNVTFVASVKGVEFRLAEIEAKVEQTNKEIAAANKSLAFANEQLRVAVLASRNEGSKAELAKVQKEIEQLGTMITEVSKTSADALVGLGTINSKIEMLPAVDHTPFQEKKK
jgi:hypothetical protein